MNVPKRHHYLPICYLEGFTDEKGLLWVFDRMENQCRRQTPVNTAVQSHYYRFEGKDGKRHSQEIESLFSYVESDTKPVLVKLNKRLCISPEDKEILAYFVSFLMTRVPAFEKAFNESVRIHSEHLFREITASQETIREWISRTERETGKRIKSTPEELCEYSQRVKHWIELPREYCLEDMLKFGEKLGRFFRELEWSFSWTPEGSSFITNDSPVFTSGTGVALVPLTPNTCLFIKDRNDEISYWEADQEIVQGINSISYSNSDRFLIANSRLLLEETIREAKDRST